MPSPYSTLLFAATSLAAVVNQSSMAQSSTLASYTSTSSAPAPTGTGPSTPPYYNQSPFANFSGDPFQKYTLTAQGINASFIPYGARMTNLYVPDMNGNMQDIVIGYDNGTQYLTDTETNHTYFGCVVGRYANRIKNGTFTINGQTSYIPENEHGGEDTLHGGFVGYDQANWTIAAISNNSITFTFYDAAMSGFPGDVLNVATYTLADGGAFISRLVSIPMNEATPIMLANHIYWNLGAFVNEEAQLITNSTLYMPYADRVIDTDGILVPTGQISIVNGTALDFATQPKAIGDGLSTLLNNCGTGCVGIDNGFILDRPRYGLDDPNLEVLNWYSPVTGIQMSLETNQQGIQIYTCNGQNGTIPLKADQQHLSSESYVDKYGCLVIETQDWIGGVDYPEWGREQYQIFTPTTLPAVNYQRYQFSVRS